MTFKRQRRTNTDMSANTALPVNALRQQILLCQCSRPVVKQKCTYENMAASVTVATLLRNKDANMLKLCYKAVHAVRIVQIFFILLF